MRSERRSVSVWVFEMDEQPFNVSRLLVRHLRGYRVIAGSELQILPMQFQDLLHFSFQRFKQRLLDLNAGRQLGHLFGFPILRGHWLTSAKRAIPKVAATPAQK